MTKKHEKLVEEIARSFCICCGDLDWDSGLCERIDPPTDRLCDLIKRIVPDVITLILSAVRDGRLDEELGVVGHGKGYADTKGYDSGFAGQADVELEIDEHTVRRSQVYDGERLEFIALRETGKEEKK